MRPVRATALYIAWSFKAFALTGRQVCVRNNPGRCPGLGASALTGRVEPACETSVQKKNPPSRLRKQDGGFSII